MPLIGVSVHPSRCQGLAVQGCAFPAAPQLKPRQLQPAPAPLSLLLSLLCSSSGKAPAAPALSSSSLTSSAGKMLLHVRNAERFEQQDMTLRTFILIAGAVSPAGCEGKGLALGWGSWVPGIPTWGIPWVPTLGIPWIPTSGIPWVPTLRVPWIPNLGGPLDSSLGSPLDPNFGSPLDPSLGGPHLGSR